MEAHSLRAPTSDGGILAVPDLAGASSLADENARRLDAWEYDFQGRSSKRLRQSIRQDVLARAREFAHAAGLRVPEGLDSPDAARKLVVTGHQPELFHPGVWVKNFAAAAVARRAGGLALNLIVDNDVPKGVEVRVPQRIDGVLRVARVPFDAWHADAPYEDFAVADEALFAGFGDRVRGSLTPGIDDPLIDDFWPKVLASRAFSDRAGMRFAIGRHGIEADWGVTNLELPLSTLCETETFLWFACRLLAELPRFRTIHNEALRSYRKLYGIRSRNHPVPALAVSDDWQEAPFWVWRAGRPRRMPLLIRPLARTMELRIGGEDDVLLEIPLAEGREACCAVDALASLPARGVRLRTRALTTTMFARYLLGDLFLHGIGGAKYDELGDEVGRRFFGIDPPQFLTLSMTLWLGLQADTSASTRLEVVDRRLRDLLFNPDRYLPGAGGTVLALIESKRAAIAGPVGSRSQRRERLREIRRCNAALQPEVEPLRQDALRERAMLIEQVRRSRIARSREFAIVLYGRERLRQAMIGVTRAIEGGVPPTFGG